MSIIVLIMLNGFLHHIYKQIDENTIIFVKAVALENLVNDLIDICHKEQITQLRLAGNQDYIEGIKEQIIEKDPNIQMEVY